MAELRRYTGTQTLQLLWSLLALVAAVLGQVLAGGGGTIPSPATLLVCSVAWFVGLVGLGFRERRHWNRMVESSSFQRRSGTQSADLERILHGRSVDVSTRLPTLLSQTHTVVSASVEGVDASFTIRISRRSVADSTDGITTGNDVLDERFVVEGRENNVAQLLSTDVQRALMDVETAGKFTITGDRVEYLVPFTRLTDSELDDIAATVISIVERLEAVGADRSTSSGPEGD